MRKHSKKSKKSEGNDLEKAFYLYCKGLNRENSEQFMSYLNRYLAYCVSKLVPRGDPDYEDFISEGILRIWSVAASGLFPKDDVKRFVAGINTVCKNRILDLLEIRRNHNNFTMTFTSNPFRKKVFTPLESAAISEVIDISKHLAGRIYRRRRFVYRDITLEQCHKVVDTLLKGGDFSDLMKLCDRFGYNPLSYRYAAWFMVMYNWEYGEYKRASMGLIQR